MNTEIEKLRKEIELLKRTLQPIGSIQCFATLDVPDSWLPCDGRSLIVKMYPELYQKIGNVFGGVPNKTFCLPDLQGRFIRGWDKEWNLDSGRKFGSTQEDAFQGHGHVLDVSGEMESAGYHNHMVNFDKIKIYYAQNSWSSNRECTIHQIIDRSEYSIHKKSGLYDDTTYKGSDMEQNHTHALPVISVKEAKTSAFNPIKVSTETRPKNIALLYCIKVK